MKHSLFFLLIFTMMINPLKAEEVDESAAVDTESTLSPDTGSAASQSAHESTSTEWKNWVFAGSAAIALTVGVLIVSLNTGQNP